MEQTESFYPSTFLLGCCLISNIRDVPDKNILNENAYQFNNIIMTNLFSHGFCCVRKMTDASHQRALKTIRG